MPDRAELERRSTRTRSLSPSQASRNAPPKAATFAESLVTINKRSGNVLRLHFPRAVAAVRAARANEHALAARSLVPFEPPVQPGQVDFGEVATARAAQVTAMPDVLAEEHDRDAERAEAV